MTICNTSDGPIEFRDPRWTPFSAIDCEVLHEQYGWIPFTASPSDDRAYGRELFEFLSTEYVDQVEACPESVLHDSAAYDVLERRAAELTQSDWVMAVDSQVANQEEWIAYRQALRDITDQEGYPFEVTFPDKPDYIKA